MKISGESGMAVIISTIKLTEHSAVLEIPADIPERPESLTERPSSGNDVARWLEGQTKQPIVFISAYSGMKFLEQSNHNLRFGFIVQSEADLDSLKRQLRIESEERSKAQEALRKNQVQLSQVSSILHDINNLLLVIYFSSEQVLSQLAADDPIRPAIKAIQETRLQATLLARQGQSHSEISREEIVVDLNELVAHSEQIFRRLIRGNVIMTVKLSPTPAMITAEREVVEPLILNLILNALSAIPEGGWVTIETEHEDVAAASGSDSQDLPPGRYVRLSISDTGSGTPASRIDLPSIGELELQTSHDSSDIAMSTFNKIVNRFGGRVDIITSADSGTKVEIRFPVPSATSTPQPPSSDSESAETLPRTILIVEDVAYVRKFIAIALKSQGYRVFEAADGQSATTIVREHPGDIDLLLTDSNMPGVSGRQLATELQSIHPQLAVVYMSGLTRDEVVPGGASNTEALFLKKPFGSSELLSAVRNALSHRSHAS